MTRHINDPVELAVVEILDDHGFAFIHESEDQNQRLDFFIPELRIYIECKRFHSDRTSRQLEGYTNVILIQGWEAVVAFGELLNRTAQRAVA